MLSFDEGNKLGNGRFGTVFLGLFNGQPVAVKKINYYSSFNSFDTEIKIQSTLQHQNIVKLFTSQKQHDCLYLVLEFMELGDLFDVLFTKKTALDSSTCMAITQDIVSGLGYLHDKGFLHRDIKLENILLDNRLQAKIADFGYAIEKKHARTSQLIGTKQYIAPELAVSKIRNANNYEYNELTDIYALGIMLLEMIRHGNAYRKSNDELSWEDIAESRHHEIPKEMHPILADAAFFCLIKNQNARINTRWLAQLLSILRLDAEQIPPAINGAFHVTHFLAQNGHLSIIEKVIARNSEFVNIRDDFNQTPLLWAASKGHCEVASFLINQNANLNIATQLPANHSDHKNHNNTSLDWAIKGNHDQMISLLMMNGAIANHMPSIINGKTLYDSIKEGNLKSVQMVLQCNSTFLNQTDDSGYTLLHYAARTDQIKIVRYLIAVGVNLDIVSVSAQYRNMTALDIALTDQKKYDNVAILLLNAGARIPRALNKSYHAIHSAAKNDRIDLVKKLITDNPGLIHAQDNCNQTALLWAASRGYDDIVAFLISQGANVNTASQISNSQDNNNSPLDWAIKGGHHGCVSLLLQAGATANKHTSGYNIELLKNNQLFFNSSKKATQMIGPIENCSPPPTIGNLRSPTPVRSPP